jgi:hypothetical protein
MPREDVPRLNLPEEEEEEEEPGVGDDFLF